MEKDQKKDLAATFSEAYAATLRAKIDAFVPTAGEVDPCLRESLVETAVASGSVGYQQGFRDALRLFRAEGGRSDA